MRYMKDLKPMLNQATPNILRHSWLATLLWNCGIALDNLESQRVLILLSTKIETVEDKHRYTPCLHMPSSEFKA